MATPVAVVQTPVFTFDRLSPEAKARALRWASDKGVNHTHDWWDGVYADFLHIAEIIGVEIATRDGRPCLWFGGLFCKGRCASFDGRYAYAKGCKTAIREYAPTDAALHAIVDGLADVQRRAFYGLRADVRSGLRGWNIGADVTDVHHGEPARADHAAAIEGALNRLCRWLVNRLEEESLALGEDDALAETMVANEWLFTETGKFFAYSL